MAAISPTYGKSVFKSLMQRELTGASPHSQMRGRVVAQHIQSKCIEQTRFSTDLNVSSYDIRGDYAVTLSSDWRSGKLQKWNLQKKSWEWLREVDGKPGQVYFTSDKIICVTKKISIFNLDGGLTSEIDINMFDRCLVKDNQIVVRKLLNSVQKYEIFNLDGECVQEIDIQTGSSEWFTSLLPPLFSSNLLISCAKNYELGKVYITDLVNGVSKSFYLNLEPLEYFISDSRLIIQSACSAATDDPHGAEIFVYDLLTFQLVGSYSVKHLHSIAATKNFLFVGTFYGKIYRIDLETKEMRELEKVPSDHLIHSLVVENNLIVASTSKPYKIAFWDQQSLEKIREIDLPWGHPMENLRMVNENLFGYQFKELVWCNLCPSKAKDDDDEKSIS